MQELRGKATKRFAFIIDWIDAAELCAGGAKCQQQLLCQPEHFAYLGLISPVRPSEGFVHFSNRISDLFYSATLGLRYEVLRIIHMHVILLH